MTVNGSVTLHQRYIYRGYLQIAALDLTRTAHPALWYILWDPSQPVATRPLAIQINGTWYTYGIDLTKNICELYSTSGTISTTYTYDILGRPTARHTARQGRVVSVERFWRTYKHDCFLINEVKTLEEARQLTAQWLTYYNQERPHARLGNLSPSEYCRRKGYPPAANFLRDFSASIQLASLRSAPSLRSGRCICAPKSRKKWIDKPHGLML